MFERREQSSHLIPAKCVFTAFKMEKLNGNGMQKKMVFSSKSAIWSLHKYTLQHKSRVDELRNWKYIFLIAGTTCSNINCSIDVGISYAIENFVSATSLKQN